MSYSKCGANTLTSSGTRRAKSKYTAVQKKTLTKSENIIKEYEALLNKLFLTNNAVNRLRLDLEDKGITGPAAKKIIQETKKWKDAQQLEKEWEACVVKMNKSIDEVRKFYPEFHSPEHLLKAWLSDAKGKRSNRKLAKWNEAYKSGIRNKKLELARWLDAHPEFKPKPRKRVKVVSKSAKFDTPCSRKPFNKCTATDYILSNGNQKTVINERVVKAKPVSKRKKASKKLADSEQQKSAMSKYKYSEKQKKLIHQYWEAVAKSIERNETSMKQYWFSKAAKLDRELKEEGLIIKYSSSHHRYWFPKNQTK